MSGGPFALPLGLPPTLERFFRGFASFWDNQPRVEILGILPSGNDTIVRFRASRATQFVRVHVQATAVYDELSYEVDERLDFRTNRQRDYTVLGGADRNIWLIPEFVEGDGTYTRFDGAGANGEDLMAFASLGNSRVTKDIRDELELIRRLLERLLVDRKLDPITNDEG